jgi:amino acid adenylation domain-containing protein
MGLKRLRSAGERILLAYPNCLEFVVGFFGCLYAAAIPVPVSPPSGKRAFERFAAVAKDAEPRAVLATPILSGYLRESTKLQTLAQIECLSLDDLASDPQSWSSPSVRGDTVALIQYSSGTTTEPKGIRVTHSNLLSNAELIKSAFSSWASDAEYVTWLPLFHDMGLMSAVVEPLYSCVQSHLLTTTAFLRDPLEWLRLIGSRGSVISGGPNFAYEHCVNKFTPSQNTDLNLSSWKVAFNGSESVRAETLDKFSQLFRGSGFSDTSWFPCYGLAEATLMVSGRRSTTLPVRRKFCRVCLEQHTFASHCSHGECTKSLVSVGRPDLGQEMAVVIQKNEGSFALAQPDEVGEIWVTGASVAAGYVGCQEETELAFNARMSGDERSFLRTGDLGFVCDGELFITGRLRDLIVRRGRNIYPEDIERTAQNCNSLVNGCSGAVFESERDGSTQLVLVQEVSSSDRDSYRGIIEAIRATVNEAHELQLDAVGLVSLQSVPRTTSGKVQRRGCQVAFEANNIDFVAFWERAAPKVEEYDGAGGCADVKEWLAREISHRLGIEAKAVANDELLVRMGLDSLQAVELSHSIDRVFNVYIPAAILLTSGTLVSVANGITSLRKKATGRERASKAFELEEPSIGQKALWFLHQVFPQSSAYNVGLAVRVRGVNNFAKLRKSLQAAVRNHDSLRTTFAMGDGEVRRVVREDLPVEIAEPEVKAWSGPVLEQELRRLTSIPFDLTRGPLFRFCAFAVEGGDLVVLLSAHHIVVDLWSAYIVFQQLTENGGRNVLDGEADNFNSFCPRYGEFVAWQSELLSGPDGETLFQYWQKKLKYLPKPLQFPNTTSHPVAQDGAQLEGWLSSDVVVPLENLARSVNCTLFAALLAAFEVLLYRVTKQHDFLIGVPTAGRSRLELAGIVGLLVNPITIYASLEGNPTSLSLIQQVQASIGEALLNADYPFPLLVQQLHPDRSQWEMPFFRASFVYQQGIVRHSRNFHSFTMGATGTKPVTHAGILDSIVVRPRDSQFDLTFAVTPVPEGVAIVVQYRTALFRSETVKAWLEDYQSIVARMVAMPGGKVREVALQGEEEGLLVRVEGGEEGRGLREVDQQASSVMSQFEEQVRRKPESVAVVARGQTPEVLTYQELNVLANRMAHELRQRLRGLEATQRCKAECEDFPIAVCVDSGPALMVALLGVLKSGAPLLPLDPRDPAERIRRTIIDARASMLVTTRVLAKQLPQLPAVILDEESMRIEVANESSTSSSYRAVDGNPVPLSRAEERIAYIIYTSGSTGEPKGVMVEHRSLAQYARWVANDLFTTGVETVPLLSRVSFDGSLKQWLMPLLCGKRVWILDPRATSLDEVLQQLINAGPGLAVSCVPTLWQSLLEACSSRAVISEDGFNSRSTHVPIDMRQLTSNLQALYLGGEPLSPALVTATHRVFPGVSIWNLYGPTEATANVSAFHAAVPNERANGWVPIGYPLPKAELHVLNSFLEPTPSGEMGMLYVGGPCLARGYWRQPALTAAHFIPHPFSSMPGARLYSTGDLVRRDADGTLHFVGRADRQIKLHGFRIEPEEIEATLRRHPAIAQALVRVVGIELRDWRGSDVTPVTRLEPAEDYLIVYIKWAEPGDDLATKPTAGAIRRWLITQIPSYMLPVAVIPTTEFPTSSSGKLDLTISQPGISESPHGVVSPTTECEEVVGGLWADLLRVERVGPDDDLFQLGMHSLQIIQFISRLRVMYGLDVTIKQVLEAPTVRELAQVVNTAEKTARDVNLPRTLPSVQSPVSFSQRRLWFLDQAYPGVPLYNVITSVELTGAWDPQVVIGSLQTAVGQHEILRSTFHAQGGEPVSVVSAKSEINISIHDLSRLKHNLLEEREKIVDAEAHHVFDLSSGPLVRVVFILRGSLESELILNLHHIVCDDRSIEVLLEDTVAKYREIIGSGTASSVECKLQYADFASWQAGLLHGEALDQQISYWRQQLAKPLPRTTLCRRRTYGKVVKGDVFRFELPDTCVARLKELGSAVGATPFASALALFCVLVHRYNSQEEDIIVGIPVSNRIYPDTDRMVGCFVNILPLRLRINSSSSFLQLIKYARDKCVETYTHGDIPFDWIVRELQLAGESLDTPIVRVVFSYATEKHIESPGKGLALRVTPLHNSTSKFDFSLFMYERGGALDCAFEYNCALYKAVVVERIAEHFKALASSALVEPSAPISSLQWLRGEELRQIRLWSEPALERD